jgi:hypothetical protein
MSLYLQSKPTVEPVGLGRILFHEAVLLGVNTRDISTCQARRVNRYEAVLLASKVKLVGMIYKTVVMRGKN